MASSRPPYACPDVPSEWLVDGLNVLLTRGERTDDDVCVWVASQRPTLVSLGSVGFVIEHLHHNEDRINPPPKMGGEYLMRFLAACCSHPKGMEGAAHLYQLPKQPRVRRLQ